jgi:hypothetical protein
MVREVNKFYNETALLRLGRTLAGNLKVPRMALGLGGLPMYLTRQRKVIDSQQA